MMKCLQKSISHESKKLLELFISKNSISYFSSVDSAGGAREPQGGAAARQKSGDQGHSFTQEKNIFITTKKKMCNL